MNSPDEAEFIRHALIALLLGALVGFEREYRGHEAGLRTFALTCMGAAMFGGVSEALGDSRVSAGIVQGIGFLGAGLIFHRHGSVAGLTTAVTIWSIAAIGLLVVHDLPWAATVLTLAIITVLELNPVSELVMKHGRPDAPAVRMKALLEREHEDPSQGRDQE